MVRRLALFVFLLSLVGGSPSATKAQAGKDGPDVWMETTRRDFGDVFAGEELEQNFPVRNLGTKPLELAQKSTLSLTGSEHHSVAAAVWRRTEPVVRLVAAMRPAPT